MVVGWIKGKTFHGHVKVEIFTADCADATDDADGRSKSSFYAPIRESAVNSACRTLTWPSKPSLIRGKLGLTMGPFRPLEP